MNFIRSETEGNIFTKQLLAKFGTTIGGKIQVFDPNGVIIFEDKIDNKKLEKSSTILMTANIEISI